MPEAGVKRGEVIDVGKGDCYITAADKRLERIFECGQTVCSTGTSFEIFAVVGFQNAEILPCAAYNAVINDLFQCIIRRDERSPGLFTIIALGQRFRAVLSQKRFGLVSLIRKQCVVIVIRALANQIFCVRCFCRCIDLILCIRRIGRCGLVRICIKICTQQCFCFGLCSFIFLPGKFRVQRRVASRSVHDLVQCGRVRLCLGNQVGNRRFQIRSSCVHIVLLRLLGLEQIICRFQRRLHVSPEASFTVGLAVPVIVCLIVQLGICARNLANGGSQCLQIGWLFRLSTVTSDFNQNSIFKRYWTFLCTCPIKIAIIEFTRQAIQISIASSS